MKFKLFIISAIIIGIWLLSSGNVIKAAEGKGHPELTEQEKLTPCAQCHQEVTPVVYNEWYQSRHGIGNVKCFQCHGTYENFELKPSVSHCASCHAQEVSKAPKDKYCGVCHPAHKFSVHK